MKHTISVRVENKFGVLTRITSLFSGRGFNIDTLNVAPTEDPAMSKMTLVVVGDDKVVDQVTKLLNKLVNVIEVHDFKEGEYVDRELVLIKVKADARVRPEVMQFCEIFRAKIVNVQSKDLTIEITGDELKIGKFLELMGNFGVLELTRTGKVVLPRE
ncbi:MAG: acetolactate synthase small subunit [Verrucomicrobiales bacterium]|jgi:acetolactate synthase-1/3 small subunit|nr:acetolactate synthase small subunit [Verrucomicrobiales bacterium]